MAQTRLKPTTDPRQIAIYVRKSKVTESGKSIEIQKEKCVALARSHFDARESDILIYEDEGKSGFYADRPQYKKMLKDIEAGKLKAVVCYKIDRISRRTIDLLNLIQQMEQKCISFISVSDRELDTSTRTGKIMISMLSAIAEFERDIIAERITDNMYELAKDGRWLGGKCPLGYYSKKEKINTKGQNTTINHLELIAEEQRAVKRIFELFMQLSSFTSTANKMNEEGFKTSTGKPFTLIAVKNILQNPVYAIADADIKSYFISFDVPIWADDKDFDGIRGIMAYNKTEQFKEINAESTALDPKYTQKSLRRNIKDWIVSVGKHKGIISGADWIKAKNIMSQIATDSSSRPKEVSKALLSGLVRCSICGGKMFVRAESGRYNPDGSVRFRYICDAKYRKKGGCENSPNVKGYDLDTVVIKSICDMALGQNEFFEKLLSTKNVLQTKTKETANEELTLKKRLSQIDAYIQNQISNLRLAPDTLKQSLFVDIEKLMIEREEKQTKLDILIQKEKDQKTQIVDIEKTRQTIVEFPCLMQLIDHASKIQLLKRIIECIIVKNGEVHIFLKGATASSKIY